MYISRSQNVQILQHDTYPKKLYYTFILLCAIQHMEFYRIDPTYMYTIISKNLPGPTIPIPSMRFMLG